MCNNMNAIIVNYCCLCQCLSAAPDAFVRKGLCVWVMVETAFIADKNAVVWYKQKKSFHCFTEKGKKNALLSNINVLKQHIVKKGK